MIERFRSPRPDRIPDRSFEVRVADTGGAFRPDWRMQDPSRDPREPWSGEAFSTGEDHGWCNCTMVAAALAYAYHARKQSGPQGGDFRHAQSDMEGGTDLYDAKDAWAHYGGATLEIRSGAGWSAVERAHEEGRAIIIQGEGNVPGSEGFDGSHACCIGIETNSEGQWLWGDPLATGWQWVSSKQIREWAQALNANILFAVSATVGEEMPGLAITGLRSFAGKVTMVAEDASAISLATQKLVGLSPGTQKEAYMAAQLDAQFGGFPVGTEVLIIGEDAAAVIRSQVDVEETTPGDYQLVTELYVKKT
jgi:hypothetical protein